MSAFCEVTRGVGDTWVSCSVRNSELIRFGAKGLGFHVDLDFQLKFRFLVVEMENCRHRFCSARFCFPVGYLIIVATPVLSTPSSACQS